MTADPSWLPPLIRLSDHDGNWRAYLDAIYGQFCEDFVRGKPVVEGMTLRLKRGPLLEGKEPTFWHFIQSGPVEQDRIPDLRRCERIAWPRAIIEAMPTSKVVWWRNARKGDQRIVIGLLDFSYVVVLADRGPYVMPWTAYCVETHRQREKHRREYEAYRTNLK